MVIGINPQSGSGGYAIISDGELSMTVSSPNGTGISTMFPLAKGKTLSLTSSNNVTVYSNFVGLIT